MIVLKWIIGLALTGYLGLLVVLYVTQRSLMYFPYPNATAPAVVGLPQAEVVTLTTADGERVIAWHIAPRGEQPVILYFHGNGGSVAGRAQRFRALTADGTGLLALSYRGYGGSSGQPSEAGLLQDADAAYAFATARYPAQRLVAWGESLGSGVAVALAAEHPVGRVVLEAPYSSTVEIAAAVYPHVPVRWLMKDQFRSDLRIGKVKAPVLILHGEDDEVIPIASAERLYALITAPKHFERFAGGHHEGLAELGALQVAKRFIHAGIE